MAPLGMTLGMDFALPVVTPKRQGTTVMIFAYKNTNP
jgi:hypothetical protein